MYKIANRLILTFENPICAAKVRLPSLHQNAQLRIIDNLCACVNICCVPQFAHSCLSQPRLGHSMHALQYSPSRYTQTMDDVWDCLRSQAMLDQQSITQAGPSPQCCDSGYARHSVKHAKSCGSWSDIPTSPPIPPNSLVLQRTLAHYQIRLNDPRHFVRTLNVYTSGGTQY